MKTVIIGNIEDSYLKAHIIDICTGVFSEIIVMTPVDTNDKYYLNLGIKVYNISYPFKKLETSDTKYIENKKKYWDEICNEIEDIDVLQVHYCLGGSSMYCYKKLADKSRMKYMVYWGSDLMRADQNNIEWNLEAIQLSNEIICLTESLKKEFVKKYGKSLGSKVRVLDFGVTYEDIENISHKYSTIECKEKSGFPVNRISIMIGYNGGRPQQHLKVLNEIKKLEQSIKDRLFLFFPMSYGLEDEKYREQVEKEAIIVGIPYLIIDTFLEREELVVMRLATDILIHAQITDALSASVCECLYAGARLINPDWIDYPEFNNNSILYGKYKEFDQLGSIIIDVIDKIDNNVAGELGVIRNKLWYINERNNMIYKWKELLAR